MVKQRSNRWATIFPNGILDCFEGVEAGIEGGGAQKLHQDLRVFFEGQGSKRRKYAQIPPV